jgi:hypothetical protein
MPAVILDAANDVVPEALKKRLAEWTSPKA